MHNGICRYHRVNGMPLVHSSQSFCDSARHPFPTHSIIEGPLNSTTEQMSRKNPDIPTRTKRLTLRARQQFRQWLIQKPRRRPKMNQLLGNQRLTTNDNRLKTEVFQRCTLINQLSQPVGLLAAPCPGFAVGSHEFRIGFLSRLAGGFSTFFGGTRFSATS